MCTVLFEFQRYGFQTVYRGEDTSHCCRSLARNSEYKFRVSRLKVLTRNSEYKFRVSRTKNKCVVIVAQHFVLSWCHVPIKQSLSLGQVREKCFSSPPTLFFFFFFLILFCKLSAVIDFKRCLRQHNLFYSLATE